MRLFVKLPLFVFACLVMVNAQPGNGASRTLEADLVIFNATVRTMDARRPVVEAVAVYGNRVAAIGTSEEMRRYAGARTRVVDARGALVLPGFNDAHVHFLSGGFQLSSVDLRDAVTPTEFAERIRRFAEKLPPGRWVTGGDWDHERWPTLNGNAPLPTKELIDAFTADRPVFVSRLDGHMALANSHALKLAGITRLTPDPPGGLIVRDPATGEPTGVLKDNAMAAVYAKIPDPTFEEKLAAARAATAHAASLGVTSVQDVSAGSDVGVYQTLLERGELKTRVYAVAPLGEWKRLADVGMRARFGGEMLRIGGLKAFSDGSLGSTTALFFEPYADAPETRGLGSGLPEGEMLKRVREADRAGL